MWMLCLFFFAYLDSSSNAILVFFFNDTATTEIYTLSLHDALPICRPGSRALKWPTGCSRPPRRHWTRSEEHTSELQSREKLVCRLLLEKKKDSLVDGPDDSLKGPAQQLHVALLAD